MTKISRRHEGFLYALYLEGYNASEAHAKLLKVTEIEVVTLKKVKRHFKKIRKARELTMKVDKSIPDVPHITKLLAAPPICEALMAHCNLSDRLTLRKVSHLFKNIVENSRFKLKSLMIGGNHKERYTIADNFEVRYTKVPNGYVVNNGTRTVFKRSRKYMRHLHETDLKTILGLSRLEIDELKIDDSEDTDITEVEHSLWRKVLESLDILPKVRRLRTTDVDNLKHLDPTYIKVVEIANFTEEIAVFDVIFESEQWKNLKELITDQQIHTFDIVENFGHLDYVDLMLQEHEIYGSTMIFSEQLVALKDKLLTQPTLQKFEIIPLTRHNPNDPIFLSAPESFLPFQDPNDEQWYHFKYPDSEEQLSVRIAYDGILFKGPCYCGDKVKILDRRTFDEEEDESDEEDEEESDEDEEEESEEEDDDGDFPEN